jgi:hypothetical protein
MKKNTLFIIIGVVILLAVVGNLFLARQKTKVTTPAVKKDELGAIPTVDATTKVTLKALTGNKEIVLNGAGIPNGTTSVDYELSYDTKAQGKQGVIGTISTITNNGFEKQMTLGTCSSGRCVYHEVVSAIQVTVKFTGEYGEKILVKEFSL